MSKELKFVNLAEILGEKPDNQVDRVVEFVMGDGLLGVVEACDGAFLVWLDADELQKLIDWLTEAKQQITDNTKDR